MTETKITNFNILLDFDPSIPNYNFEYVPTPLSVGGVYTYIDNGLKYRVFEKTSNQDFQALRVTIDFTNKRHITCDVIYRQHNGPEKFLNYFDETLERLSSSSKLFYKMTDANTISKIFNSIYWTKCSYTLTLLG